MTTTSVTESGMCAACASCAAVLIAEEVDYHGAHCNTWKGKNYCQHVTFEMAEAQSDLAVRYASQWSMPDHDPFEDGFTYG